MGNVMEYVDSPEYLFKEIGNDAELTGTIISFDRESIIGTGYMTVRNRKNELYRICYNVERYDGAFKIGGTYHFIGCTTGFEETDKYIGSLRADKLIDLSKTKLEKNDAFLILERMLKVLDKKEEWEKNTLFKYKKLPIDKTTIQDDNILMEFIDAFEGLWGLIETTIKQLGKDRGVYVNPSAWSSELFDETVDYLNYISRNLSNSFNSSAKKNYIKYEFEKQFGESRRKGTKGIITNSLAYTLAFAVVCGINDTMDEIYREQKACSSWEQKQHILISGLNKTWQELYDSKVVPMIKEANKECVQIFKHDLFEYFECTETEYNNWLSSRVEKRNPTESWIAELNELILKNRKIIEESGWFPFGQKATNRKNAENEIRYLESEIKAVQRHPNLDGSELWIYNLAFNSYEAYNSLTKNDGKLKLVFNNCRQIYEIRTNVRNSLIGYTDRLFVANYSRYRKLEAEIFGFENMTPIESNMPDKYRVKIRLYDME